MEDIKSQVIKVNVTPKKRVLRSIARDLDLTRSVLELIDNSIDAWKTNNTGMKLVIDIHISKQDRKLTFKDNSGGVPMSSISQLFTLGDTGRSAREDSIGEFGVGLKRALFSLSKDFTLDARYPEENGFHCPVNVSKYLADDEWELVCEHGTKAPEGSTIIEFIDLNFEVSDKVERELRKAIAETYVDTLTNNGEIFVNSTAVNFNKFNQWTKFDGDHAEFSPKRVEMKIDVQGERIGVDITVGLMETFHQTGDYGFYIYCNDRLAIRDGKDTQLGFNDYEFSYPHARFARFRCEVRINGRRDLMPWNSTKSGLNYDHEVMQAILPGLKKLASPYLKFCSKLASSGDLKVTEKPMTSIPITTIKNPTAYFDQLPPITTRLHTKRTKKNPKGKVQSWKKSLKDVLQITDNIFNKKAPEHKNRVVILLLDSAAEVGMRAYLRLVINTDDSRKEAGTRGFNELVKFVKSRSGNQNVESDTWTSIDQMHRIRDKLYHEFSDMTVEDSSIVSFKAAILDLFEKLLEINYE